MKKFCLFAAGYCLAMLILAGGTLLCKESVMPFKFEEAFSWTIFTFLGFIINLLFGLLKRN